MTAKSPTSGSPKAGEPVLSAPLARSGGVEGLDLTSPKQLASLLARYEIRPSKHRGQNFLIDRNILDRILEAAETASRDSVLEIGAGVGTLTQAMARQARKVLAVEIDRRFLPVLQETVGSFPSVELIMKDFLTLDLVSVLGSHPSPKWKVVGNLPYYITTPILERLIEDRRLFRLAVVMMQKEVGERIVAAPGSKDYGSLSVFIQCFCQVEILRRVSKSCFFPPPQVDSVLVRLTMRRKPAVAIAERPIFSRVVRAAFGQRRKILANALSGDANLGISKQEAAACLDQAGIAGSRRACPARLGVAGERSRRAEELSLAEFAALAKAIEQTMGNR